MNLDKNKAKCVGFRSRYYDPDIGEISKSLLSVNHPPRAYFKVNYYYKRMFDVRHCIECEQDKKIEEFDKYETTCIDCFNKYYQEVYGDEYREPTTVQKRRARVGDGSVPANGNASKSDLSQGTDKKRRKPRRDKGHSRKPSTTELRP